ncbi:LysM domain-containing protein [Colletotrichum salicis]|uniref:LysM domain-containing protein n=1 Tax=Colletotrichum salicis TaxID=1209931 RepID=A0A135U4Z2_9PEZI|nr:LysM domain-containing protein [Colletotrichum salicis]
MQAGRTSPAAGKSLAPQTGVVTETAPRRRARRSPSATTANGGPRKSSRAAEQACFNQHKRDNQGNILKRSGIRYTCDEFPHATWVEGGSGWANNQPANTRCAVQACFDPGAAVNSNGIPVRAEQDWQANAHATLRRVLLRNIRDRRAEFPWHDVTNPQRDTAFFRLIAMDLGTDGNAAVVFKTNGITGMDSNHEFIHQAQRRGTNVTTGNEDEDPNEPTRVPRSRYGPSFEEALEHMRAGHYRVVEHIPAEFNDSFVTTEPAYRDMTDSGIRAVGLADLNINNRTSWRFETPKWQEKKRASAKLNKARLESPLRNQYRLKPGTVIGGATVDESLRARRNDPQPPPLLEITDEIAWAAALPCRG